MLQFHLDPHSALVLMTNLIFFYGSLKIVVFVSMNQKLKNPHCTVGVQMELKHEEATFSYIASLLRFKGTLLRYYGAETYSVIKSLITNKDFCPGRL